jgi:hypothetical protein
MQSRPCGSKTYVVSAFFDELEISRIAIQSCSSNTPSLYARRAGPWQLWRYGCNKASPLCVRRSRTKIYESHQHDVPSEPGWLTCFDAFASSEFCSNSRKSPTLKGYESRIFRMACAGVMLSPKESLMAAMTQLSFGGRRTNSGSRCRCDRWEKEEVCTNSARLSVIPLFPMTKLLVPALLSPRGRTKRAGDGTSAPKHTECYPP